MTLEEFDALAQKHAERACFMRLFEAVDSDKSINYGVTITAEDVKIIRTFLLNYANERISTIEKEVKNYTFKNS